jgi:predicted MFS family arabinose efflux permease
VSARGRGGRLNPDARRILCVQALRAFAYGLGSVLIGVTLEREGLSGAIVGLVLGSLLAGSAIVSVLLARYGDRLGRRRVYMALLAVMGIAGAVFALTAWPPALVLAALTGTVSTDVVESGPLTSIEQAMLAHVPGDTTRLFGAYNTVATLAGSLGALAAGGPTLLDAGPQRLLFAYPIVAAVALVVASRLSRAVELEGCRRDLPPLHPSPLRRRQSRHLRSWAAPSSLRRSRGTVRRLSALFALDSFGGGFVVHAFLAYWLARRFDASPELLGTIFFAVGILQALSFQASVRLARRIGLLRTMVFTHLPSNLLLAAVALAPSLEVAIALLLARFALSQMDVPARQAYVVAVVDPSERTAAAAYTNAARYAVRPVAPLVAGALLGSTLGAPFVIAGTLKSVYDLGLYALFRRVPVPEGQTAA